MERPQDLIALVCTAGTVYISEVFKIPCVEQADSGGDWERYRTIADLWCTCGGPHRVVKYSAGEEGGD